MTLKHGVSDWPMPAAWSADPPTSAQYHELTAKTGIPFVPDAAWKDAVFAAAIVFAVMACAFYFGPFGPTGTPDPTIIQSVPKPDFAFLWIYAVLAFLPANLETAAVLIAPVLIIAAMLALPLVAGEGERHWGAPPGCGADGLGHCPHARHLHPPRRLHAVEPHHGSLDRRSHSAEVSRRPHAAGSARVRSSYRTSSAATAIRSPAPAANAAQRSTPSPRA